MRRRPPPLVSAVNLVEVIEKMIRGAGRTPEEVNDAVDLLIVGGLAIRARLYHRTQSSLSLADCACLATAVRERASLATTDPALARAARGIGVDVVALPDSSGRLP